MTVPSAGQEDAAKVKTTFNGAPRETNFIGASAVVVNTEGAPDVILFWVKLGEFTGGHVSGVTIYGDSCRSNSVITVQGHPNSAHYLDGWTINGEKVPDSEQKYVFSFALTTNVVVTPIFTPVKTQIIRARQHYPWNNLVDIDYSISEKDAADYHVDEIALGAISVFLLYFFGKFLPENLVVWLRMSRRGRLFLWLFILLGVSLFVFSDPVWLACRVFSPAVFRLLIFFLLLGMAIRTATTFKGWQVVCTGSLTALVAAESVIGFIVFLFYVIYLALNTMPPEGESDPRRRRICVWGLPRQCAPGCARRIPASRTSRSRLVWNCGCTTAPSCCCAWIAWRMRSTMRARH